PEITRYEYDPFLMRVKPGGTVEWVRSVTLADFQVAAIDGLGTVTIVGTVRGGAKLQPGDDSILVPGPISAVRLAMFQFSRTGVLQALQRSDADSPDTPALLAIAPNCDLVLTGKVSYFFDADFGTGVDYLASFEIPDDDVVFPDVFV